MNPGLFFGILLIAMGAFSSGSFAVPFGKIRGWQWETYWMIFSFGAYILFPLAACLIFTPDYVAIISASSSKTVWTVFFLGAVYGVGNLSFGLALRYLGLSLGYALSLGLMLAIGTLIPPMIDGRLDLMMHHPGGMQLISGVIIASVGIALSAWAGILKDKHLSKLKKEETIGEFNLIKGLISSLTVGITGSAMSLGFEQGIPISQMAAKQGTDPLFTMMPVLIVLFSGTFITTIVWCFYLGRKNKSLKNYLNAKSYTILTHNYSYALMAGILWFGQFILYGMGKSKMGPFTFTSWGILMALTIVFATVWGVIRKEWKGAPMRVYVLMALSLLIIIVSSFIIGISGSE